MREGSLILSFFVHPRLCLASCRLFLVQNYDPGGTGASPEELVARDEKRLAWGASMMSEGRKRGRKISKAKMEEGQVRETSTVDHVERPLPPYADR